MATMTTSNSKQPAQQAVPALVGFRPPHRPAQGNEAPRTDIA
jgi:hypothetical protein